MVDIKVLQCVFLLSFILGNTKCFNFFPIAPGSVPFPHSPAAPSAPGTPINPEPTIPVASLPIDSTGPGQIDTSDSLDSPATGGSENAALPDLPPKTIPKSKDKSIHFISVDEGLWDGFDFNYELKETQKEINDKQCESACMHDSACVVAVHCLALEEEPTPTTAPPPVNFQIGGALPVFNVLNLKSQGEKSTSYNCHIFREVDTPVGYTPEDSSSWGSDCQYIAINPKCRNMTKPNGWLAMFDPIMDEGQIYTQKFRCADKMDLSISCGIDGVQTVDGTCDDSSNIGSPSAESGADLFEPLPLPGLSSSPGLLFNSILGGFSSRIKCADDPCHVDAYCEDTISSHTCTCKEGYEGNGVECTDIVECESLNKCPFNSDCINTVGSFNCQCHSGFSGGGCEDVNECEDGSVICGDNEECQNTEGSYECQCSVGYSGFPCEDIDECAFENVCNSSERCVNTDGSYDCETPSGEDLCTYGYVYDKSINYCFKVHVIDPSSYFDAKETCLNEGAKLASLSSRPILTTVRDYLYYIEASSTWLDAYQTYAGWYEINLWGDGNDVDDMKHWYTDQPDSFNQKCVEIAGPELFFMDDNCYEKKDFVCEKSTRTDCALPFISDSGNWNCLLVLDEPMYKDEASSSCPDGSRLAFLKTEDQIELVTDYMLSNGITDGVWVGARTYGGWWANYAQWGDGVFVDENRVYPGPYSIYHDCWVLDIYGTNWKFDDRPCYDSYRGVCEKPYPETVPAT